MLFWFDLVICSITSQHLLGALRSKILRAPMALKAKITKLPYAPYLARQILTDSRAFSFCIKKIIQHILKSAVLLVSKIAIDF